MAGNADQIEALLRGLQTSDPRLYDIIRLIAGDLRVINNDLFPIVAELQATVTTPEPAPAVPINFEATIIAAGIRFTWEAGDTITRIFEVRKGTDWDTATFIVRTPSLSAVIDPIATGSHTYLIKALNSEYTYSESSVSLVVVVPTIGTPTVSASVIDNNVLLYWTVPTSPFGIVRYYVYKDGTKIGENTGTFIAIFELVSGTFTYAVEALDAYGNVGTRGEVICIVSQPPDFVLEESYTSLLDGTIVNGILFESRLLVCIDPTVTYEGHFLDNLWDDPQEQIDAGYPYFNQPAVLSAKYVETHDFGTVLTNVILNLTFSFEVIVGTVTVSFSTEFSDDGSTWSTPASGQSLFAESVRYVRTTVTFTGADDTSLAWFWNLVFRLDVKLEMDSGKVSALASDASGTTVSFGIAFKDVKSITLDANSTVPLWAMFNFVDAPYPTDFKVLVFDTAGVRADADVSWKARGII